MDAWTSERRRQRSPRCRPRRRSRGQHSRTGACRPSAGTLRAPPADRRRPLPATARRQSPTRRRRNYRAISAASHHQHRQKRREIRREHSRPAHAGPPATRRCVAGWLLLKTHGSARTTVRDSAVPAPRRRCTNSGRQSAISTPPAPPPRRQPGSGGRSGQTRSQAREEGLHRLGRHNGSGLAHRDAGRGRHRSRPIASTSNGRGVWFATRILHRD